MNAGVKNFCGSLPKYKNKYKNKNKYKYNFSNL